jgi:hypothetical protein
MVGDDVRRKDGLNDSTEAGGLSSCKGSCGDNDMVGDDERRKDGLATQLLVQTVWHFRADTPDI